MLGKRGIAKVNPTTTTTITTTQGDFVDQVNNI